MRELGRVTLATSAEWRIDYVPEASSGAPGGTFVIMRRVKDEPGSEYEGENDIEVLRTDFIYGNGLKLSMDDAHKLACEIIRKEHGYE